MIEKLSLSEKMTYRWPLRYGAGKVRVMSDGLAAGSAEFGFGKDRMANGWGRALEEACLAHTTNYWVAHLML